MFSFVDEKSKKYGLIIGPSQTGQAGASVPGPSGAQPKARQSAVVSVSAAGERDDDPARAYELFAPDHAAQLAWLGVLHAASLAAPQ